MNNQLRRIKCLIRGHIPINVGSGLYDKYGFLKPEFEKTKCARCGIDISILNGMALIKKLDKWELDENTKRSLAVKGLIGGLS